MFPDIQTWKISVLAELCYKKYQWWGWRLGSAVNVHRSCWGPRYSTQYPRRAARNRLNLQLLGIWAFFWLMRALFSHPQHIQLKIIITISIERNRYSSTRKTFYQKSWKQIYAKAYRASLSENRLNKHFVFLLSHLLCLYFKDDPVSKNQKQTNNRTANWIKTSVCWGLWFVKVMF